MKKNNSLKFLLLLLVFLISPLYLFCQFQQFAESYSLLSTVAGKGDMDISGTIGWKPEFENGNALDAELTRPHFAMADSSGNIYIADKDAQGIRKVTPEGIIKTIAGTNVAGDNGDGLGTECQLSSPNGIWVKADGTVYILDLGNDKIRRLNTNDSLETIVDDENGYSLGRGLWVTPSEDTIFYASASRIKMWTKENGVVIYATGFSGLGNITMDKHGYLVATDRSASLVYRISKDGNTKEIIAGNGSSAGGGDGYLATETALYGVRGVWFLDDNSYFVATHEGSQIWYIDTGGIIHLFLNGYDGDEFHSGDGENYRTPGYKISEPRSVSVDYEGNVLIVENDYGYVRKIKNDYTYYYTGLFKNTNVIQKITAYPNPAKTETSIKYQINKPERVIFTLYNNLGEEIMIREDDNLNKGIRTININTAKYPDGMYYYSLSTGDSHITKKLLISK